MRSAAEGPLAAGRRADAHPDALLATSATSAGRARRRRIVGLDPGSGLSAVRVMTRQPCQKIGRSVTNIASATVYSAANPNATIQNSADDRIRPSQRKNGNKTEQ